MPILIISPNGHITRKTTLAAAAAAANTVGNVVMVTSNTTVSADVTMPAVEFRICNRAVITVSSGKTLNLASCEFTRPNYACFTGAGSVTLPTAGPGSTQTFAAAFSGALNGTASNASALNNQVASYYTNASNLASGAVPFLYQTVGVPIRRHSGSIVGYQAASATYATVDTAPTTSNGEQLFSSGSIAAAKSGNIMRVHGTVNVHSSTPASSVVISVFAGTNILGTIAVLCVATSNVVGSSGHFCFDYVTTGTVGVIYSVRGGVVTGLTWSVNGYDASSDYGGTLKSTFYVDEIAQ